MLDSFFNWFRPNPKFQPGQLVAIPADDIHKNTRYMLIENRRWMEPTNEMKKQWGYDGFVLEIRPGVGLVCTSGGYGYLERNFLWVRGLEY